VFDLASLVGRLRAQGDLGGEGSESLCLYIVVLALLLLVLYVGFILYNHFVGRWVPRPHYCKYCGRMVYAISDCCHTYVDDQHIPNTCKGCGKSCRTVCNLCKRQI